MRATMSGYYRNLNYDQNKVVKELFDVTKQISSGTKIQYAYEGISTFVDTVRLDNEITTLTQVRQNAGKALQVSTNTDTTMNEMTKILESMKVKLVAASNETNSVESLNALAAELRGLEKNLIQLANTSINGNYLFSGSEVKTKPIDANGTYQGNDKEIQTFLGSGVSQTYNINGDDLFLGEENGTKRKISLNVPLLNQTALFPDVMVSPSISRNTGSEEYITVRSTIRDLMGDTDENIDALNTKHHFYIQGTNHEGIGFKSVVSMRDDETVNDLMVRIGEAFGNSPISELVTVTINNNGQIEIEDKRAGSSKLDFHMVANTDITGPVADTELLNTNTTTVKSFMQSEYSQYISTIGQRQEQYDPDFFSLSSDFLTKDGEKAVGSTFLSSIFRLDVSSIDFSGVDSATPGVALPASSFNITATSTMQDLMDAIDGAYDNGTDVLVSLKDGNIIIGRQNGTAPDLNIVLRSYDAAGGAAGGGNLVEGMLSDAAVAFDESEFKKDGNKLLSNVSQVRTSDNSYASLSTKLVDVAGVSSLNGENLTLEGIDINGNTFQANISLSNAGSTFTVVGAANNPYTIFNVGGQPIRPIDAGNPQTAVSADNMTYKQLTDVMNMIITGNLPASSNAITGAGIANDYNTAVTLSQTAAITDLSSDGKIQFNQLNSTTTQASFTLADANASNFAANASVLSFQSNNSLEISDAKTNFFKQIDEAISSVEAGKTRADGNLDDPRNVGMQNAIQALDDLSNHLFNQHSKAGVQSQTLQVTSDRTDLLIITTQTLRSQTLDIDIAEASLSLQQLTLNYQAMLSTVSRVTQLSLVNYL